MYLDDIILFNKLAIKKNEKWIYGMLTYHKIFPAKT